MRLTEPWQKYTMTRSIEINNVSKRYTLGLTHSGSIRNLINGMASRLIGRNEKTNAKKEEFWALKDISFDVDQGDIVGIVGRNGAGKSTLLKILSKITSPTTGHIEMFGRTASLLEVGTGFHKELTGMENIYLNGTILGMTKTEINSKLEQIIAFAEIDKFIHTPVKRYSSGMFVRLAFAVAAHLDPEILIVDEVLAVGDFDFQRKCLGRMEEITAEGRTVLFVSHNLGAVGRICNRVVLLRDGKIWDQGDTQPMLLKYQGVVESEEQQELALTQIMTPPDVENGAKIVSIQGLGNDDKPLKSIGSLESLKIRMEIEIDQPDQMIGVELVLFSTEGSRLATLASHLMGETDFYPSKKSFECIFEIPSLPLAEGEYFLSGKVTRPGSKYLYEHSQLAELKINSVDLYGSGYPPKAPLNLVAFNATCSFKGH